jgi:SAM-dependent methyltransferase
MGSTPASTAVRVEFGDIDIYLFDQILRGRFDDRRRILDAGCGSGRNLPFFLKHGFDVCAVDADHAAVEAVRRLAASLHVHLPADNFHTRPLDQLPWTDAAFDAVISSAVLHFARDDGDFAAMLREMWRVLKPGGLFFARLATSIGLEQQLSAPVGRVRLPDGSDRYVVDEATLLAWTERLGGRLADPLKTTNVQHQRAMTTWVLIKN